MKSYRFFILLAALFLVGCKEQELLKGLDQTQANEIVAVLQSNNIDATKKATAKEGYSVSVGQVDFPAAVSLMNIHNLPSKPRVEIAQLFPTDSLVSSPRAEKARLYSAIEQRLEQSLLTLQPVVSARVHVSYDLSSSEGERNKRPIHLSALIQHSKEVIDSTLLISDVKRFLKNSFEDVSYDNISVVLSLAPDVQRMAPIVPQKGNGFSPVSFILVTIIIIVLLGFIALQAFKRKTDRNLVDELMKKYVPKKGKGSTQEVEQESEASSTAENTAQRGKNETVSS